jgi:ABC-type sulfate transport system permease subunit
VTSTTTTTTSSSSSRCAGARALLRLGNALLLGALAAQLLAAALFGSKLGDFVGSVREAIADQDIHHHIQWPPFEALLLIPVAAVVGLVGLALILTSLSMRRRARRAEELL